MKKLTVLLSLAILCFISSCLAQTVSGPASATTNAIPTYQDNKHVKDNAGFTYTGGVLTVPASIVVNGVTVPTNSVAPTNMPYRLFSYADTNAYTVNVLEFTNFFHSASKFFGTTNLPVLYPGAGFDFSLTFSNSGTSTQPLLFSFGTNILIDVGNHTSAGPYAYEIHGFFDDQTNLTYSLLGFPENALAVDLKWGNKLPYNSCWTNFSLVWSNNGFGTMSVQRMGARLIFVP